MKKTLITFIALVATVFALTGCDLLDDMDTGAPEPSVSSEPKTGTPVDGESNFTVEEALAALESLPVEDGESSTKYEREKHFGSPWQDVDKNGCDTRNDILQRDFESFELQDGSDCVVDTGVLNPDPYTGEVINFQYGQKTSSAVQIDHIIPLSYGWHQGADGWSQEDRIAFANDPENLIASDGPANNCKSDAGLVMEVTQKRFDKNDSNGCEFTADDVVGHTDDGKVLVQFGYMPNVDYRCTSTQQFVYVLSKYDLAIKPIDQQVAADVLASC